MKTVLITGASSGIGSELAYVYADNGYNLFLTARREEKLKDIKNEIEKSKKVKVDFLALDLSKPDSAEVLFAKTQQLGLQFEIVINNAGFGIYSELLDSKIKANEMMLNLNILSLTKLTQLYAEQLVGQGGGQIVNIASTAAFQAVPFMAAYAATKAYVLHFSEAIAYELKPKNVFVTTICPGATESEFGAVAGFEGGEIQSKMPSSKDLAEFTFNEVKKKKVMSIHGTKNSLLTFGSRFMPRKIITSITAKILGSN